MLSAMYSVLFLIALLFVGELLKTVIPEKWFHPNTFPFRIFRYEKYKRLGGKIDSNDAFLPAAESAKRLRTSCRSESIHWIEMLFGGGCLAISPGIGGLIWAIWVLAIHLPAAILCRRTRWEIAHHQNAV